MRSTYCGGLARGWILNDFLWFHFFDEIKTNTASWFKAYLVEIRRNVSLKREVFVLFLSLLAKWINWLNNLQWKYNIDPWIAVTKTQLNRQTFAVAASWNTFENAGSADVIHLKRQWELVKQQSTVWKWDDQKNFNEMWYSLQFYCG